VNEFEDEFAYLRRQRDAYRERLDAEMKRADRLAARNQELVSEIDNLKRDLVLFESFKNILRTINDTENQ
jgi:uncharacterized protein YigA (DUF484 family)